MNIYLIYTSYEDGMTQNISEIISKEDIKRVWAESAFDFLSYGPDDTCSIHLLKMTKTKYKKLSDCINNIDDCDDNSKLLDCSISSFDCYDTLNFYDEYACSLGYEDYDEYQDETDIDINCDEELFKSVVTEAINKVIKSVKF